MIDINVYVIALVTILILMLIGMLKDKVEWAVFPGMATVIGTFFTLSVYADGSISQLSNGAEQAIASASTAATSPWQFLSLIPMIFTFSAFLLAVYKVGSSF